MKKQFLAALAMGLMTVSSAFATGITPNQNAIYTYNAQGAAGQAGGALGAAYGGLNLTYTPALNNLRITSSFTNNVPDAFWLAVSPGPNPKGNASELAVIYVDMRANRYAAYNYNGVNGSDSYIGGTLLASGATNAMRIGNNYSFALNVNNINNGPLNANAGWTGMEFSNQAGVWYHFFDGSITFNNNGTVRSLNAVSQGWSDISNGNTTTVCRNILSGGNAGNGCCPGSTPNGAGGCCPTGGSSSGGAAGCNGSSSSSSGQVPLPGTVLLMGLGLVLAGLFGRKART
jgi:hypothetical protein